MELIVPASDCFNVIQKIDVSMGRIPTYELYERAFKEFTGIHTYFKFDESWAGLSGHVQYLKFDSEADYIMFVLKWS